MITYNIMKAKKIIFVTLVIIPILCGCVEQNAVTTTDAYSMAKEFIKDKLKAPATAIFPPITEVYINQTNKNTWIVICHVDAENTYGALIRETWSVEMTENSGTWTLLDIDNWT